MFFDEEMLLDLRLNIMDKYVDKFVITEATYMHSGKPKKLIFDIKKFSKFKDKIIYIIIDEQPPDLFQINDNDNLETKSSKKIMNAKKREVYQVQKTREGFVNALPDDIIIISDLDEIPNLENVDFKKINQKLIFFKQKMYYYKLNLFYKLMPWYGSKACKKKFFISPEWLRSTKNKKYPIWRPDIIFSRKKYNDIHFVLNGGWHFTNIRKPEDLEKKFLNFLHHQDFEYSGLKLSDIKEKVKNKKILYDLGVDQRDYKWSGTKTLRRVDLAEMPSYLSDNFKKYSEWFES